VGKWWIVGSAVALSLALAIALRLKSDSPSRKRKADVQHYFNVDEVVASPDFEHVVRVHGRVEPGSLLVRQAGYDLKQTFRLAFKGETIFVRHTGVVPDLVRDDAECIVTGELSRDGDDFVLDATDIVAKPPSF
jgi:cytochrome c-type biogenesis protein CcmE